MLLQEGKSIDWNQAVSLRDVIYTSKEPHKQKFSVFENKLTTFGAFAEGISQGLTDSITANIFRKAKHAYQILTDPESEKNQYMSPNAMFKEFGIQANKPLRRSEAEAIFDNKKDREVFMQEVSRDGKFLPFMLGSFLGVVASDLPIGLASWSTGIRAGVYLSSFAKSFDRARKLQYVGLLGNEASFAATYSYLFQDWQVLQGNQDTIKKTTVMRDALIGTSIAGLVATKMNPFDKLNAKRFPQKKHVPIKPYEVTINAKPPELHELASISPYTIEEVVLDNPASPLQRSTKVFGVEIQPTLDGKKSNVILSGEKTPIPLHPDDAVFELKGAKDQLSFNLKEVKKDMKFGEIKPIVKGEKVEKYKIDDVLGSINEQVLKIHKGGKSIINIGSSPKRPVALRKYPESVKGVKPAEALNEIVNRTNENSKGLGAYFLQQYKNNKTYRKLRLEIVNESLGEGESFFTARIQEFDNLIDEIIADTSARLLFKRVGINLSGTDLERKFLFALSKMRGNIPRQQKMLDLWKIIEADVKFNYKMLKAEMMDTQTLGFGLREKIADKYRILPEGFLVKKTEGVKGIKAGEKGFNPRRTDLVNFSDSALLMASVLGGFVVMNEKKKDKIKSEIYSKKDLQKMEMAQNGMALFL